jgi:hypothetical protein
MKRRWAAVVSALVILACAAGCAASTLSLRVVVESTGIDGSVKADAGVFTSDDVPFGTHLVQLVGVPSSSRVDDGAERTIRISEQRRFTVLRFNVSCN